MSIFSRFRRHREEQTANDGIWPTPTQLLKYDFMAAKRAPAQDGLSSPEYEEPLWINDDFVNTAEAVDHARRAHDQELARAQRAEEKGTRLAQTALGLLALALTLAGFQRTALRDMGGGQRYALMLPVACSIVCLVIAAWRGVETDRVGLYRHDGLDVLREQVRRGMYRAQVGLEERGRYLASWTAEHKLSALLQARAWLTRGATLLVVAAAVSIFVRPPDSPSPEIVVRLETPRPSISAPSQEPVSPSLVTPTQVTPGPTSSEASPEATGNTSPSP